MFQVSQEEFEKIVADGIDMLPERILRELDNVAIVTADCPDERQMIKANIPITGNQGCNHGYLLFGLYEGIPKTKRGSNYTLVLPDKITIFKQPIEKVSFDIDSMRQQVSNTVWHEVAHHFGLSHNEIHALERLKDE